MHFRKAVFFLALTLLITLSLSSVYAVSFTDLNEAPWAESFINRMANEGIINGSINPSTGARVFNPNNPVTKVESMALVYSVLDKTNNLKSTQEYTTKYKSLMDAAGIPDWAYKQVSYGLEHGIITTSDIAAFMSEDRRNQTNATREEVAVYFGRIMDNSDSGDEPVRLTFIDTESIGSVALPYVSLMVKEGIVSGDPTNRFNPRASITRAEMAAVTAKTYDFMLDKEEVVIDLTPTNNNNTIPDNVNTIEKREGTIRRVNQDTGVVFVYFEDINEIEMLEVTKETVILINSLSHELLHLKENYEGEFTTNDKNELLRIDISPRGRVVTGDIIQIMDLGEYKAVTIQLEDSNTQRSYRTDSYTEILVEGKLGNVNHLKKGEYVVLSYYDQTALSIVIGEEMTAEQVVDGILDGAVNFSSNPYSITLRTINNRTQRYDLDEEVVVRINDGRGYLEELTRGDLVTLTIKNGSNGLVTRIEAIASKDERKLEGTINSLTIGRNMQIQFRDKNSNELTFTVSDSTRVYMDKERVSVYDLRMPTEAVLYLEGDVVTEIEANRSYGGRIIQGRITSFRESINMMTVRHLNDSGDVETTSVYITGNTLILDSDGREIRMRDLSTDNEIFVTGEYDRDDFLADRVLVIK